MIFLLLDVGEYNKMRILITGGLGFIGFHLARALQQSCARIDIIDIIDINKIDREGRELLNESNVNYIKKDLFLKNDGDCFPNDFDYIFHFAALLGVENVQANPYKVLQQNCLMTMAVIEIAKKQKNLKKIIFTSTSEVYAGTLQYFGVNFPTIENTSLTVSPLEIPRSSYMLSKIYGEGLLHAAEIPFIILRPHNIYGPRMGLRHVIPQLLQKIHCLENGDTLEVYSPAHTRTFCYIHDAIHYITLLLKSDQINLTLNLGVENPEISIRTLADSIISLTRKSVSIKEMPDTEGSPVRRVPSTLKLQEITHYLPKMTLNEGIERTYQWYKENQFSNMSTFT